MFKGHLEWQNGAFILALWCKHRSYGRAVPSETSQMLFYAAFHSLLLAVGTLGF